MLKPILLICFLCTINTVQAEESEPDKTVMDNQKLEMIIQRLDPEFQGKDGQWQFNLVNTTITILTDETNDRMRIIVPIIETKEIDKDRLYRLLQANFDSSLDARYAIAKEVLWSTYIHPLSSLDDEEFLSGLGQTINLAHTYGSSYSSGLLTFGGGDSNALNRRKLIEKLIEKGQAI